MTGKQFRAWYMTLSPEPCILTPQSDHVQRLTYVVRVSRDLLNEIAFCEEIRPSSYEEAWNAGDESHRTFWITLTSTCREYDVRFLDDSEINDTLPHYIHPAYERNTREEEHGIVWSTDPEWALQSLRSVKAVVALVEFRGWDFKTGELGDGFYLQVQFPEQDTETGDPVICKGRKWYISPHCIADEIVKTAWLAVQTALQHEAMECFKFKGVCPFHPHTDVYTLAQLQDDPFVHVHRNDPETNLVEAATQ